MAARKTTDDAARKAARLLGARGGKAGRGDSQRRPKAHYERIAQLSAGWRRRPGTFYEDGADLFYCGKDRCVYRIDEDDFGAFASKVATLPRTARIAPTAPEAAYAAVRGLRP